MWLWIILAGLAYTAYIIYKLVIKPVGYWKKRKTVYSTPWTAAKNFKSVITKSKSLIDMQKDLYNEFPDERYHGLYSIAEPALLIRDPDLVKQITIKDFDHFVNRTKNAENEVDQVLSRNLLALHSKEWRDMRATLSPSFTSSKMKFMFNLLSDCAEQFTQYFLKQDSNIIDVEMKDISSRFTNDAIATAAFGVTVDSLHDTDNEFFFHGILGYAFVPALMRLLKIPILPLTLSNFFKRIVKETIEVREKNGVVRPDMIHLLLETRKGKLTHQDDNIRDSGASLALVDESFVGKVDQRPKLTDDDITAQVMIFFAAGFDTSSTLMSFMSHELAVHPEIQERLQAEIDETLEKCGGKVTYEALLGMKYLDMIISESLRKWPPAVVLSRLCEKDFVITPKKFDEKSFTIEKESLVLIPVVGLHYDSKYFPNPDKFDPERFSEENKSNIVPGSYLPFGMGPRSCIASRFALMETKILFFNLLSKFDIVPTEKTQIPLVITKKELLLKPDDGFQLGLQKRKEK